MILLTISSDRNKKPRAVNSARGPEKSGLSLISRLPDHGPNVKGHTDPLDQKAKRHADLGAQQANAQLGPPWVL
jgi:hypothetical protein